MPLKNQPEKELVLPTPHAKQIEVIKALQNPTIQVVIMLAGRQCGKTFLAKSQALMWALSEPNQRILWVSPTDSQMASIYRDLKSTTSPLNVIKTSKGGKGDSEIKFKNCSLILFRAAGSEDSLRGISSINYLVLDEAAFIKESTVTTIIMPMMATSVKKVFIISTPKGKNWLYNWYNRATSNPKYKAFRFKSIDNPYVNQEFIQEQRATLPEALFKQEFEAEWIDKSSVFINISEICYEPEQNIPIPGEAYYGGVDIGLTNDSSTFAVIDSQGNLVKMYRWNQLNTTLLIKEIQKVGDKWNFKKIFFEINNQGLPIFQILQKSMKNLVDITTTTKNKGTMIEDLIYLFNTKAIRCCNNEILRMELEGFLLNQNDRGTVRYAAAQGMTDDTVMGLALGRACFKEYNRSSKYIGFYY